MRPSIFIPYGAYSCTPAIRAAGLSGLEKLGIPPTSYYLIVCRLEPENHVLEIVEGFSGFPSTNKLVIVGEFGDNSKYEKAVRLAASSDVLFVGAIYDQGVLSSARHNCMAYIHGHSVGGTNPSLLEAMLYPPFIFAHDNPFNRELLGKGGAYFTHGGDLRVRLEQLERVPHNKPSDSRFETRMQKLYTWEIIGSQYLSLLNGEE